MKSLRLLFTFCLFALAGSLYAQRDGEKPYLSKSFSPDGLKNLKIETSGGFINVAGQTSGEARIEMYVRGNNGRDNLSESELKERLEKYYSVNIEKSANTLTAIAKRTSKDDWNSNNGLSISFKVYVPVAIATDLRTSGGSIRLADLSGELKAETSGGSIDVSNLKGNANVHTSGGSITVENITGKLVASTSGGSIRATGNMGDSKLNTSGGSIRLNSVSGSLEANTSGGSINADIAKFGERLTLSTSGGSIEVKMPMDKGMDLDLQGDKVQIAMNNFNGLVENDRVKGKLNGGGIPVRIHTSGGRVKINQM
jgi:hypothetical protein